jgi:hypothetical protein
VRNPHACAPCAVTSGSVVERWKGKCAEQELSAEIESVQGWISARPILKFDGR